MEAVNWSSSWKELYLKIDKKSEVTLRENYINSNVAGLYPLTLTKNFRIFFAVIIALRTAVNSKEKSIRSPLAIILRCYYNKPGSFPKI